MLQAIIGALCGVGLFFVLADVYRIPYLKTSKAVESLSKKQKVKTSTLNVWLGNLADFLKQRRAWRRSADDQIRAQLQPVRSALGGGQGGFHGIHTGFQNIFFHNEFPSLFDLTRTFPSKPRI